MDDDLNRCQMWCIYCSTVFRQGGLYFKLGGPCPPPNKNKTTIRQDVVNIEFHITWFLRIATLLKHQNNKNCTHTCLLLRDLSLKRFGSLLCERKKKFLNDLAEEIKLGDQVRTSTKTFQMILIHQFKACGKPKHRSLDSATRHI